MLTPLSPQLRLTFSPIALRLEQARLGRLIWIASLALCMASCGGDTSSSTEDFVQVGNPPAPLVSKDLKATGQSAPAPAVPVAQQPTPAKPAPAQPAATQPAPQPVPSRGAPQVAPAQPAQAAKPAAAPTVVQERALVVPKAAAQAPQAKDAAPAAATASPQAAAKPQPAPSQAPQPKEPQPQKPQSHQIRSGETLFAIAKENGLSVEEILAANPSVKANRISVGDVLVIPTPGAPAKPEDAAKAKSPAASSEHKVVAGDTLASIARKYGMTTKELTALNPRIDPRRLSLGTRVRVAGNVPATAAKVYTIVSGDTLAAVARRYGVTTAQIMKANPGLDARSLSVGTKVNIP